MSIKSRVQERRVSAEGAGELKEKTVAVNRVAKVVKGGRRFNFSALVVSGDGRGHVGFGTGKAAEVPMLIRKATETSHKNLVKVPLRGTTVPHDVVGVFGPTSVILMPAAPGTGVIAGVSVRAVLESAGVRDIRTKVIGSSNPHNVVWAVFDALVKLRDPESLAALRGKTIEELQYTPY